MDTMAFNGINLHTGDYLFPPMTLGEVAALARGTDPATAFLRAMKYRDQLQDETFSVAYGIDADRLDQTGWGVVFPENAGAEVREALQPLLDLRRDQASDRYYEFEASCGETADDFLMRQGMGPGPADPDVVPYYLLVVGPPTAISFPFQYLLDVQYAVGRLDLDSPAQYRTYANAVVAAEDRPPSASLPMHLFGTSNTGDFATAMSSSRLVAPLGDKLSSLGGVVTYDIGPAATKPRLLELLEQGPPILFTASHGLGDEHGATRALQGALLCQDWPGPLAQNRAIAPAHYLAGTDVTGGTAARVMFSFACYSAGFPDPPYVTDLPKRLLSSGLLGFVGHVDRAWTYSFLWTGAWPQITPMASALRALHDGHRLGAALESVNQRWADIAARLTETLNDISKHGKRVDDEKLAWLWTASNDARDYIVLGDPAVRPW